MRRAIAVLAGLVALTLAADVRSEDEKVALKDVPKAAVDAVKAKFPGAELRDEAEKEVEKGQTSYEISLKHLGKKITVEVNADGKINEIETEVAVADLPKAVVDAIAKKHPGGVLKKAEEIVEYEDGEEEKAFEVVVAVGGKSLEVTVGPDGKIEDSDGDED